MGFRLVSVGFGNIVSGDRLIAIVSPDSAPIKRIIQEAREAGRGSVAYRAALTSFCVTGAMRISTRRLH